MKDNKNDITAISIQITQYNKNAKKIVDRRFILEKRKETREEAREVRNNKNQNINISTSQLTAFETRLDARLNKMEDMIIKTFIEPKPDKIIKKKKVHEMKENVKKKIHQKI